MLERVAIIAAARVFALGVAVAATAGPSVTRLRKAAAGWGVPPELAGFVRMW
jgi:hypothetical protein